MKLETFDCLVPPKKTYSSGAYASDYIDVQTSLIGLSSQTMYVWFCLPQPAVVVAASMTSSKQERHEEESFHLFRQHPERTFKNA